ncbi:MULTISPECIES: MFS transporter [Sphingobacterium]|uniref:MFS transporter n=1 Tax=Sphingobacterium TaxID=28453 RepID=UPI0004E5F77C|nr:MULTISPECIES: MFS transporter [Sphingobacterium]UPZ38077.1 MFS transporter [Sphingobacterium sp. PCS056]WGQ13070.1 MFS transporter [Sphingobacterium faecium]CDS93125.1 conserved membrane protein similar to Major facilitator superfamily [Sphingobacterium sp. PM2-P1-29]SJN51173.1 Macrolide-efflux protein [Sphingobacterium faecium PCAi_F2.5]
MEKKNWFQTYLYIWIGQFVSLLTSSAVNFAVIVWLSLTHKSAEVLALAGIAGLLPQALIGPFVGVFIDRWDRKKVMIFADAFIALCTLLMTFVLQGSTVGLSLIYLLLACRSIGSAFHAPAMQAIAPLMVPEDKLLRVSGINQMLQSVSSIAGPALGTLAITYFSISQVLYLDVIGAAVAIISLLFVTIPHLAVESTLSIAQVWDDLKQGMKAIYHNRGLSLLFLYAMIATFCVMPIAIMFPLLTIGHFNGGKWEMSVIEIIWGVGMLVGGGLLSAFKVQFSKVIMINTMHIVLGLTFAFSGWFPATWFIPFVVVTAIGGMAMSLFSASFMTTIQEEVAPQMLGRVFSLYFSLAILPSVVGLLFTGFIADVIGVAHAFVIAGILMMVVGILSFFTPAVMRLGKK